MARKSKKDPAADAASVAPIIAPMAAPFPSGPAPTDRLDELAASHLEGDRDLVHHSQAKEVARRTAKGCSVWYHSPAILRPLVEAARGLIKSAKAQGWTVTRVNRVHAYFHLTEEAIYLVAADDEDLEALPVTGWPDRVQINLYDLMRSNNQDLPIGKSVLLEAHYESGARTGPALVIWLKKEKKVKWEKEATASKASGKKAPKSDPALADAELEAEDEE